MLTPSQITWSALLLLAIAASVPLAWVVWARGGVRGRRDVAVGLHRAQLEELDRDLAMGRIGPAEHGQARLEVQRRMLAAAGEADAPVAERGGRWVVLAAVLIAPVAALGLYLINGQPALPSAPFAHRAEIEAAETDRLIATLRQRLAGMDARSEQARQGYVLLGNIEASRGNYAQAAAAWRAALAVAFDPTIAAEAAESIVRAGGVITPEAADLFRRALAAAPADAEWRELATERLKQVGAAR